MFVHYQTYAGASARNYMTKDLEIRNMKALSDSELEALNKLKVSEWQEIKGGSFIESIEAWQDGESDQVLGLCFLLENQLVGLTLFKRPPASPDWASPDAATIHGLKISTPWQGQGLGHKAFQLAIPKLKEQWPSVTKLMLSVDADNTAAIAVYRAFGMTEFEPMREGPNGQECRLEISL